MVSRCNDSGIDEEIACLSVNDYFGEMALVRNEKRAATIPAAGPLMCYSLDKTAFSIMFGDKGLNLMFANRKVKRGAIR